MSAMATPPPPAAPRLDTVLSFSDDAPAASPAVADDDESATPAFSDAGSGSDTDAEDSDSDFEFAFAPPLSPRAGGGPALAPADDLFAHGRIVPAYPLFDRHLLVADGHYAQASSSDHHHHQRPQQLASTTAPPSPDTYCAWAPRSAPGSPSRDSRSAAFPKSSSTGEARRFWRLRDLVAAGGGRCHSDGREKFVFLQPSSSSKPAAAPSAKPSVQKQGKKQKQKGGTGKATGATEMDMATAHRLFYGKPGAASSALAGDRPRQQQQQSYLPYRPGIVGFFASAHALGRSSHHHPY